MTPFRRTLKQRALVAEWSAVPIGTVVLVRKDDGSIYTTRTRSAPWMLGDNGNREAGHTAVIMVEGISGCYSLERIQRV